MAQTRLRNDKQLGKSTTARSLMISDASNEASWVAPPTGADKILFWDDSVGNWAPLTIGTNLSLSNGGTQLDATAGAGGYVTIQEEGSTVGSGNTVINFVGSSILAANQGAGVTSVTTATKLNNIVDNATLGLIADTGSGAVSARTITGTASRISVSNGNGQAGNPTIDIDANYVGQASITTVGTIATGTWNATTISPLKGGTGLTSATTGDILYASGANTWAQRNIGSAGNFLRVSGGLPVWTTAAASDLSDGANIAHINATETISAVWTFNTLPESSTAPTTGNQFTNKTYVDGLFQGVRDYKESVRVASTANVTVTYNATGGTSARGQITAAPNTLNGVSLATGNRILLKDQSTGAQNGIWVVTTVGTGANGVWDRATDFDADSEVTNGLMVYVGEHVTTDNRGTYLLSTPDPITIGGASGTALTFVQISSVAAVEAGAGMTQSGLTLNVIAANDSLLINPNDMQVRLHSVSGLEVVASNGIRIKSDTVTANTAGITITADGAGVLHDANTLSSTSETLAVKTQMSITSDASGLKLTNDASAPGNSKYYGTNGSGTKGYYDIPLGSVSIAYIEGQAFTTTDLSANTGVVKDRNGNNIAFTVPTDVDTMEVYRNGLLQARTGTGTTRDYSITSNSITFDIAVTTADVILIKKPA